MKIDVVVVVLCVDEPVVAAVDDAEGVADRPDEAAGSLHLPGQGINGLSRVCSHPLPRRNEGQRAFDPTV